MPRPGRKKTPPKKSSRAVDRRTSEGRDDPKSEPGARVGSVLGHFEVDSDNPESTVADGASEASEPNRNPRAPPNNEAEEILPPAVHYDQPATMMPSEQATDPSEWRTHILDRKRTIPFTSLRWDHRAEEGQIRPLRQSIVTYYIQRLITQGHPVSPVELLVKMQPGVFPIFLLIHYAECRVSFFVLVSLFFRWTVRHHRRGTYIRRMSIYAKEDAGEGREER